LKDELTTKTTSFSIVRGGVFRFGAITFVDDFYIDWKSGSRRVSDGKLDATLIADGHWLEVLSEGEKTRFDLSSLLTMTKPDLLEHNLASSEGRKGHLVISQFNRVSGPNGTQLKDLWGFIVLYGESP
jgi:hypothetical protein